MFGEADLLDELSLHGACSGGDEQCIFHFLGVVAAVNGQVAVEVEAVARPAEEVSHGDEVSRVAAGVDVDVVDALFLGVADEVGGAEREGGVGEEFFAAVAEGCEVGGDAVEASGEEGASDGARARREGVVGASDSGASEVVRAGFVWSFGGQELDRDATRFESLELTPEEDMSLSGKLGDQDAKLHGALEAWRA